jgi:hypothetical protein
MRIQLRRAAAGLLAFAALLGGATVGIAQATNGTNAHASAHHKKKHHRHHHHSRIPQHNGGDHDSDNNGGPSDGDGNV